MSGTFTAVLRGFSGACLLAIALWAGTPHLLAAVDRDFERDLPENAAPIFANNRALALEAMSRCRTNTPVEGLGWWALCGRWAHHALQFGPTSPFAWQVFTSMVMTPAGPTTESLEPWRNWVRFARAEGWSAPYRAGVVLPIWDQLPEADKAAVLADLELTIGNFYSRRVFVDLYFANPPLRRGFDALLDRLSRKARDGFLRDFHIEVSRRRAAASPDTPVAP